jgi:hypothetical protein
MDDAMDADSDGPVPATPIFDPELTEISALDFSPVQKTPEFVLMLQQELRTYGRRLEQVEKSHATIERLQRELTESQATLSAVMAENEALKAALAATTGAATVVPAEKIPAVSGSAASKYASIEDYPVLETAAATPSGSGSPGSGSPGSGSSGSGSPGPGSGAGSWSGVARSGASKASKKKAKSTPRSRAIATRLFTEISESQGFQYVYLPCRAREKYSEVRKKLRTLKVDTARILDINYPAQKVIALLIHNDYYETILARFSAAGVNPIETFDPLDASAIRDPSLAGLDNDSKVSKARELHRTRCLRALDHIRRPVCFAVAGDFLTRGWITTEDKIALQSGGAFFEKTKVTDEDNDADMTDVAAAFTSDTTPPVGDGEPSSSQ